MELRSGDVHSSRGALAFLERILEKLPSLIASTRTRVRLDGAFYDKALIQSLDQERLGYVVVAKATGTMIRATQVGTELLFERPIHRYSDEELEKVERALREEKRTGSQTLYWEDVNVGQEIPPIVREPLTIGDMVCWNAGLGPAYKAGRLGYLDLLKGATRRSPKSCYQKTSTSLPNAACPALLITG